MPEQDIRSLYYITHIDNLPSILGWGILSHERVRVEQVRNTPVYDEDIVNTRQNITTPAGKNLWSYANLFFQPRNPMLYRLLASGIKRKLAVLSVDRTVLQEPGIFITDGIAANRQTRFYHKDAGLAKLHNQRNIIQSNAWVSWNHSDELKNRLMSECLVPNQVDSKYIRYFMVADRTAAASIQNYLSPGNRQKLITAADRGSDIFSPAFKIVE